MSVLHLQHVRPDGERDTFHLKNNRRYNLGRGSGCELRILDMKMSRQHCAFEYMDDAWQLIDLGSTNGVNLDGVRVKEHNKLSVGKVVQAGSVELSVIAINDHVDLAPEELMQLGNDPISQDPMPSVTEDVPVAEDDNPWDGEPSFITAEDKDALQLSESEQTESIPTEPSVPASEKPQLVKPVFSPEPVSMTQPKASEPSEAVTDESPADEVVNTKPEPVAEVTAPESPKIPKPSPVSMQQPKAEATAEASSIPAKPRPATSKPARTPSSGDIVITALDRRIGPVSRDIARELKKKQIMGTLTDAELDQYPQA